MATKGKKKSGQGATAQDNDVLVARCMAAQGDVMFIKVDSIPSGAKELVGNGKEKIVAHSETGHHHTVDATGTVLFDGAGDPNVCYLQLASDKDFVDAVHHRDYHTHKTIRLEGAGTIWKVQRQSEFADGVWRQVQD